MPGRVETNATKLQNETGFDRFKLLNPDPYLTDAERIRFALVWQTPKVVWREYDANGYTLQEAIDSELGYAR
jgi:hypothetical protein